jgi:hypothetical protein
VRTAIRSALLFALFVVTAPRSADAQWYPFPAPYPNPYAMDHLRGSLRIEVSPRDAEVYVDGFYAGIVDDYDGTFQRLRVTPGPHEIVVRRAGYRSYSEQLYVTPDVAHRIRRDLEPLAPGEPEDPKPTPLPPVVGAPGGYGPPARPSPPAARRPPVQRMPPADPAPTSPIGQPSAYGTLLVRVQPGDAEILIDGERWQGPEGDARLVVQLPEGAHDVEIRREGYAPFTTRVDVSGGETVPLNVSLSPRRH